MALLIRSSKALNTLPSFHRKRWIIFVEGPDDIPFWQFMLRSSGIKDFRIKIAGGDSEIEKKSQQIVNEDADIIVARDCHYSDMLKLQYSHPRIMYTYGYSFENSLYCPKSIAEAIFVRSRTGDSKDYELDVSKWLNEFIERFKSLIVYDFANKKYKKGIRILGKKCFPFLKSNHSHFACERKIEKKLREIKSEFTKKEVSDAETLINACSKKLSYIIRGHFLTHAIINYIKNKVQLETGRNRKNISVEDFYTQMLPQFPLYCSDRKDVDYINQQIKRLVSHSV